MDAYLVQLFIIFGLRNGTDFNDCITWRYFVCGLAVRPNFRRQGLNAQNMYKDLGRCLSNDPYDLYPNSNHEEKNSTKLNRVIQHASVLVHVH